MTILNDPLIHKAYSQLSGEDRMIFDSVYQKRSKTVLLAYLTWLVGWQYAYFNQWGVQFIYWFTIFGAGFWGFVDLFRIPGVVSRINRDIALEVLQHIKIHSDTGQTLLIPSFQPIPASLPTPAAASTQPDSGVGSSLAGPSHGALVSAPSGAMESLSLTTSPTSIIPSSSSLTPVGFVMPKTSHPVWIIPVGVVLGLLFLGGISSLALRFFQANQRQAIQGIGSTATATSPVATDLPSPNVSTLPSSTSTSDLQPTPALTLIRPLADPVASGMPRLYDTATTMDGGDGKGCALIDPGNPTKRCKVSVSSNGQYAWGSSWCAASASALNSFMNHATLRYELDGQPIAVSQFWEGRSSTCLKRRLIVQNIPGGEQHELKLIIALDQDLIDGGSRYPAGKYTLLLTAKGV